jgi:hypothetical protein
MRTVFTSVEGDAIAHLDALLGARPLRGAPDLRLDTIRPELRVVIQRRLATAAVRFLVDGGGWRERTFLRAGRRQSGRVWDRALNDGFELRFAGAGWRFWRESLRQLGRLSPTSTEGTRGRRKLIRDLIPVEASASGDWIVLALVDAQPLPVARPAAEEVARRLHSASPLAALLALDGGAADDGEARARFAPLCAPGAVRIVECVEDALAAAWSAELTAAWQLVGNSDAPLLRARWDALARALTAWLAVLDGAGRLDLARPLARTARAVARLLPWSARDDLGRTDGLRTVDDRDQLIASVARVAAIGPRLLTRRDELAGERYGDPRFEEAQLYVRIVDDELAPARVQIEAVARALSGIIG